MSSPGGMAVDAAAKEAPSETPPNIVESSAKIVSPRVTRASLPPVTLPSGQLECPACGGAFDSWENYYGHVIAPDNKVCAWVQIDLIDIVPPPRSAASGGAAAPANQPKAPAAR